MSKEIIVKSEEIEGRLDFAELFGNDRPVHLEIGSGKGTFLVNQATAYTDINYFGIEWARKYYLYAADRLKRWGLENVRMLRDDAATFIGEHVGDETIERYHIYFPDPWPKKRHHKRRFICDDNLNELYRTLKADGVINIATDHADYFEWMCDVFDGFTRKFEQIDYSPAAGAKDGEMAGTNFERKYLREGRDVYTIAVKKLD